MVSLLSRSNPVDGISDRLKLFPPRLRYSSEVSLKSTGSSWPLSKPQSPKSSHVTRPSASPQLTPSHRQQSSPAFHESKAAMDSLVMEKELFSWSRAAAWSGKHGTAGDMALV
uniref:Uncharacterized protein n=1 Tax=Oryza nivara TaxID=4536 RepID=A0A0E0FGM0_ORYNI